MHKLLLFVQFFTNHICAKYSQYFFVVDYDNEGLDIVANFNDKEIIWLSSNTFQIKRWPIK